MPAGKPRALVIGNSHIMIMRSLYPSKREQYDIDLRFIHLNDQKYNPWVSHIEGRFVFNPVAHNDIIQEIEDGRPGVVFLTLGGNEYFLHGAARDPRHFDFYLPDRQDLAIAPNTEIIPYRLIKHLFVHAIKPMYDATRFIKVLGPSLCCLGVPPPVRDSDFFLAKLGPGLAEPARLRGVPSPVERYKLWRVADDTLREWCRDNDVRLLDPPAASVDADGYIVEKYQGDAFHAAADYADLVLRQMEQVVMARACAA
jgi:hypothetical protein